MDYQYNTSELSAIGVPGLWSAYCTETRQWYEQGQSTWESWTAAYADPAPAPRWSFYTPMQRGAILTGPVALPAFLPTMPTITLAPADPSAPPAPQTVRVRNRAGEPLRARVTLYTNHDGKTVAIDQGITDAAGHIVIYGGRAGDTLYAATLAGGLTGQQQLSAAAVIDLLLQPRGAVAAAVDDQHSAISAPYLVLRAEPSATSGAATLFFSLYNVTDAATLTLLMTTPDAARAETPALLYDTTTATYAGEWQLATVVQGTGSLRLVGLDTDHLINLYHPFQLHALNRDQPRDLFAADGALSVHLAAASVAADNSYLVIQSLSALPAPLPAGLSLVGLPYQLTSSAADLPLVRPAVLKFHLTNRLWRDEQGVAADQLTADSGLQLYWLNPATAAWQPLSTTIDVARQELTTLISAWGLYAVARQAPAIPASVYLPLIVR
jgi:hypothetical protein